MGEAANDGGEAATDAVNPVRQRQRTQVPFPYSDLQRAVELCERLGALGGKGAVELTPLAASMDQTAEGGTFRGRVSSARMFGFITTTGNTAQLMPLGVDVLDEVTAPAAKAAAFLNVPLYAKLYEQYQGHQLPQAAAIQRQMGLLGLPQKQVERARQVFAASVETAGFINSNGRFVKPVTARVEQESDTVDPPAGDVADPPSRRRNPTDGGGNGGGKDHPLIQGLLVTLPEPGTAWAESNRQAWLNMAKSIFAMIYEDGSADRRREEVPGEDEL